MPRNENDTTHHLRVRKGDISLPFSKGLLISTILNAGVGLQEADDITNEVFEHFVGEGKREVTPGEIKEFVIAALKERELLESADQYSLIEKVKYTKGSITILIGGASGVGKSTISAEVARRLGIQNIIGTDVIREIIRSLHPGSPCLQGSTFSMARIQDDIDEQNPDEARYQELVIKGFLEQTKIVSAGIKAVLTRARKEGINVVVDGANFVPSLVGEEFLHPKIAHVFPFILTLKSKKRHIERFHLRSTESRRSAQRYIDHIDEIHYIQDFIIKDAKRMNVPTIENDNFEKTVGIILKTISKEIL